MAAELSQQPDLGPVRQFSIFVENKVGRLNEMVESLAGADVHIMALCLVDTTDSTIIRIVVVLPEPLGPPKIQKTGGALFRCDATVLHGLARFPTRTSDVEPEQCQNVFPNRRAVGVYGIDGLHAAIFRPHTSGRQGGAAPAAFAGLPCGRVSEAELHARLLLIARI